MQRGRFITLEGGEGAGKSSLLPRLRAWLESQGIAVIATREPGGTPLAERIRGVLADPAAAPMEAETELLLMAAARAEHLARVIRPALARGAWVLCDRFSASTTAYQGWGRGVPPQRLAVIQEWVLQGLVPDRILLLDVPPEVGLARSLRRGTGPCRFEEETLAFHQRVRQGFLTMAREEPQRMAVIDALQSPEAVEAAARAAVAPLLAMVEAP
ncbi:MAG: dTMP kinase [Magnetococcales bacterium]|nr:dTMP kinase [Magnetococcales bacterium]